MDCKNRERIGDKMMGRRYKDGDLVVCVSNPHNQSNLEVGRLYIVESATPMADGDWVYGLKNGTETVYSISENLGMSHSLVTNNKEVEVKDMKVVATVEGVKSEVDPVNNPAHYTQGGIETIDFLGAKLTEDEFIGFLKGNVLKYVSRAKFKRDEVEDLKKAKWYLNRILATMGAEKEVDIVEPVKEDVVKPKFNVGDIVTIKKDFFGKEIEGKHGKLIEIMGSSNNFGTIEFFKNINGHSGGGVGKPDHCWNVPLTEEYLEVRDTANIPCTKKQRQYVYGLCAKLDLNAHELPTYISENKGEVREMSEMEISIVIDKLVAIREYINEG